MYYTKYRPQRFADIRRPNEVADSLMQQISTGKTVHAYLFTGPRGTGKTTMARLLAKALNCKHLHKNGDVCGKCEYCLSVQNGSLIDLIEIDAASNRGIDDIRDLREKVKLLPAEGKKKVYIIDEVHMLTNEAFNALLKTLEEPPKHAVFILCTTEFHKVPETIRSRCQVFRFRRPSKAQLVEKLKMITEAEVGLEKVALEDLERVAIMAGGAFRDAETILQQLIEGGTDMGTTVTEAYPLFLQAVLNNDAEGSLGAVTKVYDGGIDLNVWTENLLRYLRDLLYMKMGFADDYFSLAEEDLEERRALSEATDKDWLVRAIEVFNQAQLDLKSYSIPSLALEVAVAKLVEAPISLVNSPAKFAPRPSVPPKVESKEGSKKPVEPKMTREDKPKSHKGPAFEAVTEKWKELVSSVAKVNNSVSALLKSGKPIGLEENFIIMEVAYKFHKERLESSTNKKIVEKVLEELFDDRLSIKCIVNQKAEVVKEGETGDLTDRNIKVPNLGADLHSKSTVAEVFDGALPL